MHPPPILLKWTFDLIDTHNFKTININFLPKKRKKKENVIMLPSFKIFTTFSRLLDKKWKGITDQCFYKRRVMSQLRDIRTLLMPYFISFLYISLTIFPIFHQPLVLKLHIMQFSFFKVKFGFGKMLRNKKKY